VASRERLRPYLWRTATPSVDAKEIDDKLAQALLGGLIHDGDTVRVDLLEDKSGLAVEPFSLD